jgi:hypothetical protein
MMHTTTGPATHTVAIFAQHYARAMDKLVKIQRRAARYGQTISWTERKFTEQCKVYRWDGKALAKEIERVELTITGSAPQCGEYVFLAKLEQAPGGVLVSAVPGVEIGDLGFHWNGRCDHCGSNRARKVAFVVESPNGRKVVGKSCLRDHMGTDSPEGLLWQFAAFADLSRDAADEDSMWGGSYRWEESTLGVVAAARAAIALWGWRPSSHEGMTTASHVNLIYGRVERDGKGREINAEERRQLRDELKANGDHYYDTASKVIEWGRSLQFSRSDYERNLSVALGGDTVVGKTYNLVVSAAAAYDRQVAREDEQRKQREAEEAKRASMPKSYHVGEIGDRVTFTTTLERRVVLPDNGFGPSYIFVFRADDGPVLSWKTGSEPRVECNRSVRATGTKPVEVNDRVVVTATVKAHAEFRGEKETRVLRAKLAPAE